MNGEPCPALRLRRMHELLFAAYGPQHWWPALTPFEVVLGAYLTQNTSWKAVERALGNLRQAGVLSLEGLRSLEVTALGELIRPAGFITRKAPSILAFVRMLDAEFSGSLEELAAIGAEVARQRLLALPGVGPETADAICLYALGLAVPVADEYLRRIVARHGLLGAAPKRHRQGYEALAQLTREAFAADQDERRTALYNEFHALTVAVGKAHCRREPACVGCPLAEDLDLSADRPKAASITLG